MKVFNTIMKVFVALAAVAGAVYVAATYGDKIVDWAKRLLGRSHVERFDCEEAEPDEAEFADEVPVEEVPAEEEAPADENAVVADDADFEG